MASPRITLATAGAREVLKGSVMINWHGQALRTNEGLAALIDFNLNGAGSGWFINQ